MLVVFLFAAIRILREYERAVVFQLGRFWKVKGPGLILVIPIIQQAVKVDLRIRVHDVPSQDIISRDNVLVKVNAVVYYRVMDARNAIIQVEDFNNATSQLAQTTLRSVLGQHELDQMLAERDKLNADLQRILDEQTESWGIKVSNVELKHVDIDESMIRVIARQAEAERIRRAKIIESEGEFQAAQKFLDAATILAQRPEAMQLRYLSTLMTIANERSSTIVFPFPTDLSQLLGARGRADGGSTALSNRRPVQSAQDSGDGLCASWQAAGSEDRRRSWQQASATAAAPARRRSLESPVADGAEVTQKVAARSAGCSPCVRRAVECGSVHAQRLLLHSDSRKRVSSSIPIVLGPDHRPPEIADAPLREYQRIAAGA